MTREIVLANGRDAALLDDADFDFVASAGRWCVLRTRNVKYAVASGPRARRNQLMHRLIMAPANGLVVDHINHDGLDNRRANLRVCTRSQNSCNRRKADGLTSQYLGVSRAPSGGWLVSCGQEYLGTFYDEIDAARAYDAVALAKYGEFSTLNFAPETTAA